MEEVGLQSRKVSKEHFRLEKVEIVISMSKVTETETIATFEPANREETTLILSTDM